jgi:hypothetical protein
MARYFCVGVFASCVGRRTTVIHSVVEFFRMNYDVG